MSANQKLMGGSVKDWKKLGIGAKILLAHFDRCKRTGTEPTAKMLDDAKRFNLNPAEYGHKWEVR